MKKLLVILLVLAFAALALPQQPASDQTARPAQSTGPSQPKTPEIKDPAEYNSYVSAIQNPNLPQKISGLEDFITRYPNSVVRKDALEVLMAAYQESGNPAKTDETAQKLLQIDPTNVRALALLAYTARGSAAQGQDVPQNLQNARMYGEKGLQALQNMPKPEDVSPAQFDKLKAQTEIIFDGAIGFSALNSKDYPTAQKYLQQAVDLRLKDNPNDPTNVNDIYMLALAYLEPPAVSGQQQMNPLGLFWIARAAALSNNNPQILAYGKAKYGRYHGGEDGWSDVLQTAATNQTPPANFAVKPAPTLPEQAAALANSKSAKDMSIAEWELVLQYGDQSTRDKVWEQIQQLPSIQFAGNVVEANKTSISLAATEDAISANKADVVVTMKASLTLKEVPKVGAQIPIQAKPASYTQSPFLLQMSDGMLIVQKKAPPARKTPPRRRH